MENKDSAAFLMFWANLRTGNLPLVQSSLGWLARAVPLTATGDASPASPELYQQLYQRVPRNCFFPITTRISGEPWKHPCSSPANFSQLQMVLPPAHIPRGTNEG